MSYNFALFAGEPRWAHQKGAASSYQLGVCTSPALASRPYAGLLFPDNVAIDGAQVLTWRRALGARLSGIMWPWGQVMLSVGAIPGPERPARFFQPLRGGLGF